MWEDPWNIKSIIPSELALFFYLRIQIWEASSALRQVNDCRFPLFLPNPFEPRLF